MAGRNLLPEIGKRTQFLLGFRLFVNSRSAGTYLGTKGRSQLVAIAVQHWFGSLRLERALDTQDFELMPPHKLSHGISNSSFAPPTNPLHRLAAVCGSSPAGSADRGAGSFIAMQSATTRPSGSSLMWGPSGSITSNRVTASHWFCCMVTQV